MQSPIALRTFQLPVRIASHVSGPRLIDAAGNIIAYAVDDDDAGTLTELAATLNALNGTAIINGSID